MNGVVPLKSTKKSLPDADRRLRALDPSASFHLEAPAGSGKTLLLIARFLRLLGIVDHPQQILAMTFTNKAAGEMRERIGRYLHAAKAGKISETDSEAELLKAAAAALERHRDRQDLLLGGDLLRIQTFHSFCYGLVAQAPLEASIAPGSTLLSEPDQRFLLRKVIDETLLGIMDRSGDDPYRKAFENRLLYLNNSWPVLVGELEGLMQRRESLFELTHVLSREKAGDYVSLAVRELAEAELRALQDSFLRSALAESWVRFCEDLENHGAEAGGSLPRSIPGPRWEELAAWQSIAESLLTRNGEPRKRFGPSTGYYSGFGKTAWCELIQQLDPGTGERLHRVRELPRMDSAGPDWETLWDLILLLNAIIEVYDGRCRAQRVLDFSSLEMAALRLFDNASPSDLQLLLDHQIQHVLVDEFQDTNRQQWLLVRHLFAGWVPGDGRTLFVVGDPKQSIYGFRKAEVMLFTNAKQGLPLDASVTLPLESLVLTTNFRSQPNLIEWTNRLFADTVMADPRPELDEVPFIPSEPSPETAVMEHAVPPELALFINWPDAPSCRRREADWLAYGISEELKREPQSDIGVLLFARTSLPVYLEALQCRGIPVRVAEGLKLSERPEVKYLRQLCRALVLPQDHLAWASQLHSPWLLLGYSDIYAVSLEPSEAWVEKIRSYAEKDERTASFWDSLKDARRRLGHEPLADVMETAWLDLGGARIAAEWWGSRGLACCRRFFDLIREAETGEPVETLMRLEELLEDSYEPVDPDTALSRVSLMTVHRAKGLEFDTVFLPFLDWDPISRLRSWQQPYLLERVPGAGDHFLLAVHPDHLRGEPDPLFKWLSGLQAGRAWGEAKRLFYVAVTRARNKLKMSGLVPLKKSDAGLSLSSRTPLSWLDTRFGISEGMDFGAVRHPDETASEIPGDWNREWENEWDGFRVLMEPRVPAEAEPAREDFKPVEIHPAPFEREKPSFRTSSPSSLVSGEERDGEGEGPGSEEGAGSMIPRLRGVLIHRLLANYARKKKMPALAGIVSSLRHEGLDGDAAARLAESVMSEAEACVADPWLGRFFDVSQDRLFVEWPIEGVHGPGHLYAGVVDLAACIDDAWWLIDYKTSKGEGDRDIEMFCRKGLEKYSPQLLAYREIWAGLKGIGEDRIEGYIYWTAFNRRSRLEG